MYMFKFMNIVFKMFPVCSAVTSKMINSRDGAEEAPSAEAKQYVVNIFGRKSNARVIVVTFSSSTNLLIETAFYVPPL